jgi:hypothetical protein
MLSPRQFCLNRGCGDDNSGMPAIKSARTELLGDLALCPVVRGERARLARLQQRRNDDGDHRQVPGIHRTQRVPADELRGMLVNLVLWCTEHNHRARKTSTEQREQSLLITAARKRGPH